MKTLLKFGIGISLLSCALMAGKIENVKVAEIMDGVGSDGLTFVSFCKDSSCSTKTALRKINLPQASDRYKRIYATLLSAKISGLTLTVWDNAGGWVAVSVK